MPDRLDFGHFCRRIVLRESLIHRFKLSRRLSPQDWHTQQRLIVCWQADGGARRARGRCCASKSAWCSQSGTHCTQSCDGVWHTDSSYAPTMAVTSPPDTSVDPDQNWQLNIDSHNIPWFFAYGSPFLVSCTHQSLAVVLCLKQY